MNFIEMLKEFQSVGCADQTKCSLACRVYMDLLEDEGIKDLEKNFNSSLDLFYLRGKLDGLLVNFIPILSCQELNFKDIEKMQLELCGNNQEGESKNESITLAVCDTASTILYYRISKGLIEVEAKNIKGQDTQ